jgi:PadR family transcriptional regulator PadR
MNLAFTVTPQVLESCVLAIVNKEPTYGYRLTVQLKDLLDISESTLYPVLRRLLAEDYLTIHDVPFDGRMRRYYEITSAGKRLLAKNIGEWNQWTTTIDTILTGG